MEAYPSGISEPARILAADNELVVRISKFYQLEWLRLVNRVAEAQTLYNELKALYNTDQMSAAFYALLESAGGENTGLFLNFESDEILMFNDGVLNHKFFRRFVQRNAKSTGERLPQARAEWQCSLFDLVMLCSADLRPADVFEYFSSLVRKANMVHLAVFTFDLRSEIEDVPQACQKRKLEPSLFKFLRQKPAKGCVAGKYVEARPEDCQQFKEILAIFELFVDCFDGHVFKASAEKIEFTASQVVSPHLRAAFFSFGIAQSTNSFAALVSALLDFLMCQRLSQIRVGVNQTPDIHHEQPVSEVMNMLVSIKQPNKLHVVMLAEQEVTPLLNWRQVTDEFLGLAMIHCKFSPQLIKLQQQNAASNFETTLWALVEALQTVPEAGSPVLQTFFQGLTREAAAWPDAKQFVEGLKDLDEASAQTIRQIAFCFARCFAERTFRLHVPVEFQFGGALKTPSQVHEDFYQLFMTKAISETKSIAMNVKALFLCALAAVSNCDARLRYLIIRTLALCQSKPEQGLGETTLGITQQISGAPGIEEGVQVRVQTIDSLEDLRTAIEDGQEGAAQISLPALRRYIQITTAQRQQASCLEQTTKPAISPIPRRVADVFVARRLHQEMESSLGQGVNSVDQVSEILEQSGAGTESPSLSDDGARLKVFSVLKNPQILRYLIKDQKLLAQLQNMQYDTFTNKVVQISVFNDLIRGFGKLHQSIGLSKQYLQTLINGGICLDVDGMLSSQMK